MIINVRKEEINKAKEVMALFDKHKTYDKFKCNTNWIGYLGELVFDRYLKYNNIKHEWVDFFGEGYDRPDFIINGVSIDLKTSYKDNMWTQQVKHDIYIFAQLSNDNKFINFKGFMTKEGITKAKEMGIMKQVNFRNRVDWVISSSNMLPIELLSGISSNSHSNLLR